MSLIRKTLNDKGQASIEFMLVLPFFLLMVFTTILFGFRTIFAEMTLYSIFYGGRAASVGLNEGVVNEASQSILPKIKMSLSGEDVLTVTGNYKLKPLLGQSGSESLDSPLAKTTQMKTGIGFTHFIESTTFNEATDDNPVLGGYGTE